MIEKTVLDHLNGAGIRALMEIPEGGGTPPFCIVQRTGGGEENHIRRATIAIQSYGETLFRAAELNERVVETMEDLPELPEIAACELNSDYEFTDTAKKQYRYQAVFDVVYYG